VTARIGRLKVDYFVGAAQPEPMSVLDLLCIKNRAERIR
jgi:hypothetical protein